MNWVRSIGERLRPENVFLGLALTFGLAVMIANPPFQAPDEGDHFYRAFQISEGTVVGEKGFGNAGGALPVIAFRVADPENISFHPEVKMTAAIWRKKADPAWIDWSKAERAFCGFPHSVVYPPTSYVPQAAAIFIGRLIHLGLLGLMYLARLVGFAASIALGYAALRRLPVFRWSALVLLLCPMSLYLFGSMASDGVLITAAFLLLAVSARITLDEPRRATWRELALVVTLGGVLTLAKVVYLPLASVALLLVTPRLESVQRKLIFGAAWAAVCLLPLALWGRVIAGIYIPGRNDIPIDPAAQWLVVSKAPFAFLGLVAKSIWIEAAGIYRWFVGTLGWGDTPMPDWFYYLFGWGLLACLIAEASDAHRIKGWQRLALLGAGTSAVVMIFGAQYATWNAPGSRTPIEGIEGRYFLPLAPLIVLAFPPLGKLRVPRVVAPWLGTGLTTLGALVCLVAEVDRYYFD